MHGLWDITVSRDEVEGFEKLKAISQIAPIKERIRFFESKYGCTLGEFKDRIKREKEDFESGWTTSSGEHTLKA
jgi:hypothetical protein